MISTSTVRQNGICRIGAGWCIKGQVRPWLVPGDGMQPLLGTGMIFVHDTILKDDYDGTFTIKTRQLATGLWTPGSYLSLYMFP